MRFRTYLVISAIIAMVVGAGIYFTVSGADASAKNVHDTKTTYSLIGKWHQVGTGANGILMEASVSAGAIQINLKTRDDVSNIYWQGTFDTEGDPAGSYEIISQGDPDAMTRSVFGSRDKNKLFDYNNGDLSFKFTMMGTTSTIHLAKQ